MKKPSFYQARLKLLALNKMKVAAHVFSSIVHNVNWNGTKVNLEYSYPGQLITELMQHLPTNHSEKSPESKEYLNQRFSLLTSLKNFNAIHFLQAIDNVKLTKNILSLDTTKITKFFTPEKYNHNDKLLNQYLATKEENNYALKVYEVQMCNKFGDVHLSSLALCNSSRFGLLLAVGDRGMGVDYSDYRGIQLYKVDNTASNKAILREINALIIDDGSVSMEHYYKLINDLTKDNVNNLPVIPQIKKLLWIFSLPLSLIYFLSVTI